MMHTTPFCRAGLLGFFLFLSQASQAAIFGDDEARKAILQLRQRVETLHADQNQELTDLKNHLSKIEEGLDAKGRGQLEVSKQLDLLQKDLALVRGQIENLTNELSNTQRKQRDLYADLDKRLAVLEPKAVSIDNVNYPVQPNEIKAYEAAIAPYQARNFKPAVASLSKFLELFPDSPYAPQVYHWLGNAYYALRDCRNAITAQEKLIQNYPSNSRVPDALLNVSTCQIDLNDRKAARKTLETIVRDYPTTPAAETAKERLSRLK